MEQEDDSSSSSDLIKCICLLFGANYLSIRISNQVTSFRAEKVHQSDAAEAFSSGQWGQIEVFWVKENSMHLKLRSKAAPIVCNGSWNSGRKLQLCQQVVSKARISAGDQVRTEIDPR